MECVMTSTVFMLHQAMLHTHILAQSQLQLMKVFLYIGNTNIIFDIIIRDTGKKIKLENNKQYNLVIRLNSNIQRIHWAC